MEVLSSQSSDEGSRDAQFIDFVPLPDAMGHATTRWDMQRHDGTCNATMGHATTRWDMQRKDARRRSIAKSSRSSRWKRKFDTEICETEQIRDGNIDGEKFQIGNATDEIEKEEFETQKQRIVKSNGFQTCDSMREMSIGSRRAI